MSFLATNRAAIGGLLFAIGTALRAFPDCPYAVIETLTFLGSLLMGGGALASDAAKRAFGPDAK